jgi:DNA-binding NarL/FixJ family response regulator
LSLQGLVGKEVAYSTGLSQSSVSSNLSSAALRLGFAGPAELLRVGAQLQDAPQKPLVAELTKAEREVLALAQRGLTNAQVAQARGTKVNTVANQIRALLGKTGVRSRRGLLLLQL